jgi:D-3-phosphoglycerate dehydrogenase
MSGRQRVVVTQRFFDPAAIAYLAGEGYDTILAELPPGEADGGLDESSLRQLLEGAAGWILGHARVTDSLLRGLPDLKVIARRGVGYERIDCAAVRRHGKVATVAVGGNDACVADHALALMLAVAHRLRESRSGLQSGAWTIPLGSDLYRKTVGIIGLGRIGRGVARRLQGFDCRLLAFTPQDPGLPGVTCVGLDRLLGESDIVTLHAPLTPQTRFMIDEAAIARMRAQAILVNTARGGLVEDRHLLAALQAGRLQGAGLDVFVSEADPTYREVTEALVALPNVVATPHAGASTREGLDRTNMIAAESVVAVLQGRTPPAERVVADGRLPEAV